MVRRSRWVIVGVRLVFVLSLMTVGYYAKEKNAVGNIKRFFSKVISKNTDIPKDFVLGAFSNPETIELEFKSKNYTKLMNDREIAMSRGILLKDHRQEVPVKIKYKDKAYKASARLKGDWSDHFNSDKISFRINIKGNENLMALNEFSLQSPEARSFMTEWICHKLEERENLIHLRTNYVNVVIDGKKKGIYQIEEYFDNTIFQNNNLPEGILFKFEGDAFELKVFNRKSIMASDTLRNYLSVLFQKYDAFVDNKLALNNFLDVEKFARAYAITDLVRGYHQFYFNNIHFYFNPRTGLVEPIGREWNDYFSDNTLIAIDLVNDPTFPNNPLNYWFHERLFQDSVFLRKYYKNLARMSEHKYLDIFFKEIEKPLEENLSILYKNYPLYKFKKSDLYVNQVIIQKKLSPIRPLAAYYKKDTMGNIKLEIRKFSNFPIILKNIQVNGKKNLFKEPVFIGSNKHPNRYIEISLPFGVNSDSPIMEMEYNLMGADADSVMQILKASI
ncbi:MAG TPA: CotH kinase family protein [Bacteroidales bacterium]|nr:CotH kinase family protein [Bacteroidales bacterium]